MLITKKHKSSKKGDSKADANRRIRRTDFDSTQKTVSAGKRHYQTTCPLCLARIEKTASGTRRKHNCSQCRATLNTQLVCESCGTKRVWQGKLGAACVGCGGGVGTSLEAVRLLCSSPLVEPAVRIARNGLHRLHSREGDH